MRLSIHVELDYVIEEPTDILLQIEAAAMVDQRLEFQDLRVYSDEVLRAMPGEDGVGQRCWVRSAGPFQAEYHATVLIDRNPIDLAGLAATSPRLLPAETIPYLFASRYCESDRFEEFVLHEFAGLSGGKLALALSQWVGDNLSYEAGASSGITTAMSTFVDRRGVCRDYAHLLVALARAGGIPARCVSAYAPGVDPPDFHAVAELWLADRWHLIDATRMASCADLVRVVVGRDATDIAFMTVFGCATLNRQIVSVTRAAS